MHSSLALQRVDFAGKIDPDARAFTPITGIEIETMSEGAMPAAGDLVVAAEFDGVDVVAGDDPIDGVV